MIILYEENEQEFSSLGLGVLKDVLGAKVDEKLNDSFELEMTYPVNGLNFEKLKINRIIYCKANPYDNAQPFRISSITKPINGVVTVNAFHISYDMNGIPVNAIEGSSLNDVINKIQNGEDITKDDETTHKDYVLIKSPFKFNTDIFSAKSFKTTAPYNLRAIIMGGDESLINVYISGDGKETHPAELKFDKFNVSFLKHRGYDRGAKVVYGHNMTDLSHESVSDRLYNGVFPYYHTEKQSTETTTEDEFKKVYIVGTKPYQDSWLSYTEAGEPYIPLDETPVQIATEGEYKDKIFAWNNNYKRYDEKIYNEQVTLIQGVFEPTWITIDWSKFPVVTCKANKVGYFKKSTDTDWGEKKGVGDVIFDASIFNSGIMENIVLSYSEVIPSNSSSENKEVTEIIDVQLDDPIMWIETNDTRNMLHNRILNLDLTSEFDEEPTKEKLKAKAEEYINKNKVGTIKHNTTVSFVDLASTTDADKYQNFDHIELGDTVEVIYKDLDVDVKLSVISTSYDVLTDMYTEIELGEREDSLSAQSIQTGDNISSLSNDAQYADVTTVHKLIAETITAEYLEAVNAKLSSAQIKQLEVEKISATGIIEAAQFSLDTLVAKLLTADNAEIKETLKAGTVEVAGDITVKKGEISIQSEDGSTSFNVDRDGNVTANSVAITGGSFDIGDGNFTVENDGTMYAQNAEISGTIKAESGMVGGFYIVNGMLTSDENYTDGQTTFDDNSVYISPDFLRLGNKFVVNNDGEVEAIDSTFENINIKDGEISIRKKMIDPVDPTKEIYIDMFDVDSNGQLTAKNVEVQGSISTSDGNLGNFTIDSRGLKFGDIGDDRSVVIDTASNLGSFGLHNFKFPNIGSMAYGDSYKLCVKAFGESEGTEYAKLRIDCGDFIGITEYTMTSSISEYLVLETNSILEGINVNFESAINFSKLRAIITGFSIYKKHGSSGTYTLLKEIDVTNSNENGTLLSATDILNCFGKDDIYENFGNTCMVSSVINAYSYVLNSQNIINGILIGNNNEFEEYDIAESGSIKGWVFTVGSCFGVNIGENGEGAMYCTNGKIGPLSIFEDSLEYSISGNLLFRIDPEYTGEYDPIDVQRCTIFGKTIHADSFVSYVEIVQQPSYGSSYFWSVLGENGFSSYGYFTGSGLMERSTIPIQELAHIPTIVEDMGPKLDLENSHYKFYSTYLDVSRDSSYKAWFEKENYDYIFENEIINVMATIEYDGETNVNNPPMVSWSGTEVIVGNGAYSGNKNIRIHLLILGY